MHYTRLGSSGLKVSRLALGCMSFSTDPAAGEWTLDDQAAEPVFRQALDLGITFWDTANVYGRTTSEEIIGRAIRKYTRREDVVLATKIFWPVHPGPGGGGVSRKAVLEQVDGCGSGRCASVPRPCRRGPRGVVGHDLTGPDLPAAGQSPTDQRRRTASIGTAYVTTV
jgi:hypothetical protein